MTRVLVTTDPIAGHVRPGVPVVQELVTSGADVVWYTGAKFADLVRGSGARFHPISARLDFDDDIDLLQSNELQQPGLRGFRQIVRDIFIGMIPGYVEDLEPLVDDVRPDVVLANHTMLAGPLLAEKRGIPRVVFSTGPLSLSSVDTAPFGTALTPIDSILGRLRNRLLYWVISSVVFRHERATAERIRRELGLPRLPGFLFDWSALIADHYIQSSVPELEYPRRDLPASVEFVGASIARGVDSWTPPSWWPQLQQARADGRPVVFVTQGTAAIDPNDLVLPTLQALAGTDCFVVATSGGLSPDDVLPAAERPDNARLEPFIPFPDILDLSDVAVTNGGFGGVQTALALGVPLVVAGTTEDKPEVCARVRWSGTGVDLGTGRPSPEAVGAAVTRVLTEPTFRQRAQELQQAFARYRGPRRAADLVLQAGRRVQDAEPLT